MPETATANPAQFRNSGKLTWQSKFRQIEILLRENGVSWTLCFLIYCAAQVIADRLGGWLERSRISRGLPGINSVASQRAIWNSWNWQQEGEEWTSSPDWKNSIVERFIHRYVPQGSRALEIGPGAGRWTEYLIPLCSSIQLVDLSAACITECRKRFGTDERVQFHVNGGNDLAAIEDASIDRIWSFDCFVHIDSHDVEKYIHECARVLAIGGIAIIHHGSVGKMIGWRSHLTKRQMESFVEMSGMAMIECVDSWEVNGQKFEPGYGDSISVFQKSRL